MTSPSSSNVVFNLTVYELDLEELLSGTDSLGGVWPSGLPDVDGIFVCYDASASDSFDHVPQLLRKSLTNPREYTS